MTPKRLVPENDGWRLPVKGQPITRLCLDNESVRILCANAVEISIGEPFRFIDACERTFHLDPGGEAPGLAPLLPIMRKSIDAAWASKDGRLEIRISDLSRIYVPHGEQFEAWTLSGPGGVDGLKIVSIPGGDLAIWEDRTVAD